MMYAEADVRIGEGIIQMRTKVDNGVRRGSKLPHFCGRPLWMAP